jgi:hypothetical protein
MNAQQKRTQIQQNLLLTSALVMVIELDGDTFDGLLNFSGVTLNNGKHQYLLDTLDTMGNPQKDDKGQGYYQTVSSFECDEETLLSATEGTAYDLAAPLAAMLQDPETVASTYLTLSEDRDANARNLARIRRVYLYNQRTEQVVLPIEEETD